MKDIMFSMSTIKPYDLSSKIVIDSIRKNMQKSTLTYDIVTCSNKKIEDENIITLIDNEMNGENNAYNILSNFAVNNNYKYLVMCTDDYKFNDNCDFDSAIAEVEINNNKKIICCNTSHAECLTENYLKFPEGSHYGYQYTTDFLVPIYIIPRFPILNVNFIRDKLNGYVFHPNIMSGYADVYLGFFLLKNNIEVLETKNVGMIFIENIHNLDRISRRTYDWIDCRSKSLISCVSLMKEYKEGNKYV